MDNNNRRGRQNDAPQYPTGQRYSQGSQEQGQGRGFSGSGGPPDRFRAVPLTSTATPRGLGNPPPSYPYYPDASPAFTSSIPSNAMQYQGEYPPDPRQQQQQQPQGAYPYSPQMMYNVNQQNQQTQQNQQAPVYDTTQQFQQRQPPPTMQMVPEAPTPYYSAYQGAVPGAPSAMQNQASPYQSNSGERSIVPSSYPLPSNMGSIGGGAAQAPEAASEDGDPGSLDQAYLRYQSALKGIFENILNGMLVEATQALLEISEWLLTHVGELGLTDDNFDLHRDRIKLWNEFNYAWLATLQRQKDITLDLVQGRAPQPPQSMISHEFLERMGRDLVRWCDSLEKHGLVDYQCGVWEENIIQVLEECLDLLENNPNIFGGAAAGSVPRAARTGRAPAPP